MRTILGMMAAATLLLQAHVGFAAQMFTPEQFGGISNAAVAQFKLDMPAMFDTFYGVTMTRNVVSGDEIGVLVKVYTKADANSAPAVMSRYNCHKHEGETLECHPAS
jgi:hypothetical protein